MPESLRTLKEGLSDPPTMQSCTLTSYTFMLLAVPRALSLPVIITSGKLLSDLHLQSFQPTPSSIQNPAILQLHWTPNPSFPPVTFSLSLITSKFSLAPLTSFNSIITSLFISPCSSPVSFTRQSHDPGWSSSTHVMPVPVLLNMVAEDTRGRRVPLANPQHCLATTVSASLHSLFDLFRQTVISQLLSSILCLPRLSW